MRANSWQDVADLSASLGVTLDPWQELILEAAMGERSDRTWAAKRVGISVPRQNGKSQLMVARILAGALLFGEKKIVVSAHQADTAREAFAKLIEIIEDEDNEALRARLDPKFGRDGIMNALNREAIGFRNGARVQFKARTGAGSKGFSSDCLLLDEAQILNDRAWTSINSTMSAMRNPQVWLLGTPPQEEDDSYTFEMVRESALDGKSGASAWAEWSVDKGSEEYREAEGDLKARKWTPAVEYLCWASNPAWHTRINREVVQGEFETYDPERFAQDRLGLWRSDAEQDPTAFDPKKWKSLAIKPADAPKDGRKVFGVVFAWDGSGVALAAALRPTDGPVHVEAIRQAPMGDGTRWLVEWLVERHKSAAQIVIYGKGMAEALVNDLRDRGVKNKSVIIVPNFGEAVAAHAMLDEAVKTGAVTHLEDPLLDGQALIARKQPIGKQGGFGWTAPDDKTVLMLNAATFAHWGAKTTKRNPSTTRRGVTVL